MGRKRVTKYCKHCGRAISATHYYQGFGACPNCRDRYRHDRPKYTCPLCGNITTIYFSKSYGMCEDCKKEIDAMPPEVCGNCAFWDRLSMWTKDPNKHEDAELRESVWGRCECFEKLDYVMTRKLHIKFNHKACGYFLVRTEIQEKL